jgi:SAM-dependent methyltransferase
MKARRRAAVRRPEVAVGRLEQLVAIHGALLRDRRRNEAFERALAARVTPSSTVLDLGAGTGLWAVVAARLGARRVVAVEQDPLLVPLIESLAHENGVGSRVEVVCGDARRLRLGREFDVVVSETVGNVGDADGIVALIVHARDRFLVPGGALIPQAFALRAAPARDRGTPRRPGAPRLGRRVIESLALQFPRPPVAPPLRLLAKPAELLRVDLRRRRPPRALQGLSARWPVADAAGVDGIAVWLALDLAPGLGLETLSGTHWSPLLYGTDPLPRGRGIVEFHLEAEPLPPRWEVALRRGRERRARSYSPLFAYGWLGPRLAPPLRRQH